MSNGNGHHWSKFWWQDHQGDAALRSCGLAARGYWVEVLCVMHQATPVGHLLLNGKPPTHRQMAAIAGCLEKEAKASEAELEAAGVFSRTTEGVIFCRRMVRDAAASETGREHIQKRWNTSGTTHPPTRDPNTPPNRSPTSKPNGEATRWASREPTRDPIAQKLDTDSEPEAEKKEGKYLKLLTTSPASARVAEACEAPPAGTYGGEKTPKQPSAAIKLAAETVVGKVTRKLTSTGMRPAVKYAQNTVREQIIACKPQAQPQVVPPGLETAILAARRDLQRRAIEQVRAAVRAAA